VSLLKKSEVKYLDLSFLKLNINYEIFKEYIL